MKKKGLQILVTTMLATNVLAQPTFALASEIGENVKLEKGNEALKKEPISNPSLLKVDGSGEKSSSGGKLGDQIKNWVASDLLKTLEKNNETFIYSDEGNADYYRGISSDGRVTFSKDNRDSLWLAVSNYRVISIGQYVQVEKGKEYTVSFDVDLQNPKGGFISYGSYGNNMINDEKGVNERKSYTFTATSSRMLLYFRMSGTNGSKDTVARFSNFYSGKSTSQIAIEEIERDTQLLLNEDRSLVEGATQAEIDILQATLNKVKNSDKKDTLAKEVNHITELYNQRVARTAINELFTDNDPTSTSIKPTVTQVDIDVVQGLINKVKSSEVLTELSSDFTKAIEYFNQNNALAAILELYKDIETHEIADHLTQEMIDKARELTRKVTDLELSGLYTSTIEHTQDLFRLRNEELARQALAWSTTHKLFEGDNPIFNTIKEGLTQLMINGAATTASAVQDEGVRKEILKLIEQAQYLLDEKTSNEEFARAVNLAVRSIFQDGLTTSPIRHDLTQAELNDVRGMNSQLKDSQLKFSNTQILDKAQVALNEQNIAKAGTVEAVVKQLFKNDDPATGAIKEGLTNELVVNTKAKVEGLDVGAEKDRLLELIGTVEGLLAEHLAEITRQQTAEAAINSLFVDQNPATGEIHVDVNQNQIDETKDLVDKITDSSAKETLLETLSIAQALLKGRTEEAIRQEDARQSLDNLFVENNRETNQLKESTTHEMIVEAQTLINKVQDVSIKEALMAQIAIAEDLLQQRILEEEFIEEVSKEVNSLFVGNDPETGKIKEGVTQAHLTTAKERAGKIVKEAVKEALLVQIEVAQQELNKQIEEANAQAAGLKAVAELFQNNDPATKAIKPETTQETIDAAVEIVSNILDSVKRSELIALVEDAQAAFDERVMDEEVQEKGTKAVNELFAENDPVTGKIRDGLTQEDIEGAKSLVSEIKADNVKNALLLHILKAQEELIKELSDLGNQQAARLAVDSLFDGNNPKAEKLKEGITQLAIDAAKLVVEKVKNEKVRVKLQEDVTKAEDLLKQKLDTTIVIDDFTLGKDSNITGMVSEEIKTIKISINGVEFAGGSVSKGAFKFYAKGGKVKKATDNVVISGYDQNGTLVSSKQVTILEVVAGNLTVSDFQVGPGTNLVGTFSENIKSIRVDIDGEVKRGGTLGSDGKFKFYFKGVAKNINHVVVITGHDEDGYEIARKRVILLPQTPGEGYINPAPFTVGEDSNITGTYSYDVKRIEVYVDDTKYEGGMIYGDGSFKFYARTIVKEIGQKVEIVSYGLDGVETGRSFIPVVGQGPGEGTMIPGEFEVGKDSYLNGTYTGDIASIRLVVDGVEHKGGTVKDGELSFYAKGKIGKESKDVKLLGYDVKGNLISTEIVTVHGTTPVVENPEEKEPETENPELL
ncbi:toxin Cry1Ac domain D-VI-related protein [Carnobacterium maltaromaticum]|uniref:Toxin Cry1Ac domain D-VI-related protein n=1 Tax=Carnobacterium maltaromaticum TaxID=2751 RepID=A0AAW9JRY7_CARML|nr:toxin Cry1Ac domain D-VI-related protein [Carnobacterium maltaromaticum]MDZ5759262.1 toxin Cry1Ac domain D-VI-related protein [Carnobacterium maltaromaticum]